MFNLTKSNIKCYIILAKSQNKSSYNNETQGVKHTLSPAKKSEEKKHCHPRRITMPLVILISSIEGVF